jgi:hypothetical protein
MSGLLLCIFLQSGNGKMEKWKKMEKKMEKNGEKNGKMEIENRKWCDTTSTSHPTNVALELM